LPWKCPAENIQNNSHCCQQYKRYLGLHFKFPGLLSDFNGIWSFSTDFLKEFEMSQNFMEIRPEGEALIYVVMKKPVGIFLYSRECA
jgi:hypothetical protein